MLVFCLFNFAFEIARRERHLTDLNRGPNKRDADRISNVTKKKRVGFNLPELKRKEALYDGNKMTRQKKKKTREN